MHSNLAAHYLADVAETLRKHKALSDRAVAELSDGDLFATIDEESNSVAVLMKHMGGNLRSRWTDFLTTDGEKPDRHRDAEFLIEPGTTKETVLAWWEEGWQTLFASLEALTPADLDRRVTIRGEPHTVVQAVDRGLAHCAYHVGQIVFLAKHLRSTRWQSLSIPRGKSEEFNATMKRYKG